MASKAREKSNRFVVEFADADLPDRVADQLDDAVRKAALDVISRLDLSAEVKLKFRPEWRGIWIDLGRQKIGGLQR